MLFNQLYWTDTYKKYVVKIIIVNKDHLKEDCHEILLVLSRTIQNGTTVHSNSTSNLIDLLRGRPFFILKLPSFYFILKIQWNCESTFTIMIDIFKYHYPTFPLELSECKYFDLLKQKYV